MRAVRESHFLARLLRVIPMVLAAMGAAAACGDSESSNRRSDPGSPGGSNTTGGIDATGGAGDRGGLGGFGTGGTTGDAGESGGGSPTGGTAGAPNGGAASAGNGGTGAAGSGGLVDGGEGGTSGKGGATGGAGEAGDAGAAGEGGSGACGNNVIEPGEACDDGNRATGDGCGQSCRRIASVARGMHARHACVVLDDGSLKCWGQNDWGQLGLGDLDDRGDEPNELGSRLPTVSLGTGRRAKGVVMGQSYTCALLDDDSVKCWGSGFFLGLGGIESRGDGPGEMGDNLPRVDLGTGRSARMLAAGDGHTCALLDDGGVKCWGSGTNGQLGLGRMVPGGIGGRPDEMGDNLPRLELGTGRTAKSIVAGSLHNCALLDNDTVKCWGHGAFGELGSGDGPTRGDGAGEMGDALPIAELGTGRVARSLVAGSLHTCAILDDASVKCWGEGFTGALGLGASAQVGNRPNQMGDQLPKVELGTGRTARALAAGLAHTCALLDDGGLKCWGSNGYGPLGLGDMDTRGDAPGEMGDALRVVDVGAGRRVRQIAAGWSDTCALFEDHALKCWGGNGNGELGLGDALSRGDGPGEMGEALPTLLLP